MTQMIARPDLVMSRRWLVIAWTALTAYAWGLVSWTVSSGRLPMLNVAPLPAEAVTIYAAMSVAIMGFGFLWFVTTRIVEKALAREADLLKQTTQNAQHAAEVQARFAAHVGHEVRTPLHAVLGAAELLETEERVHAREDLVRTIRTGGRHLIGVVDDVLDFAKVEAGQVALESIPFSMRDCIEETLDMVRGDAKLERIGLAYRLGPAIPAMLVGDPGRIRQVLVNLIRNAIKFTDEGHVLVQVELATASGGQAAVDIRVEDTGIGIPKEQQAKIFEPFQQAEASTTRRRGGTGLGLPISRMLIEAMGGRLEVDSTAGGGATFHFTLTLGCEQGPGTIPAKPKRSAPRVLVVDEHRVVVKAYRDHLRSAGFQASAAHTAKMLDAAAKRPAPDVILATDRAPCPKGSVHEWLAATFPGSAILRLQTHPDATDTPALSEPAPIGGLVKAIGTALGPRRASAGKATPLAAKAPLRVLVAEDEPYNRLVITAMLERLGYRPRSVGDGDEAVAQVRSTPYDLVLMDVHMPTMSGIEATRRIRENGNAVRIVGLTGAASSEERAAAIAAGMDDCVGKPLGQPGLRNVLETAARKQRTSLA